MITYSRARRERRGACPADPGRGRGADRRRAGAQPRHDRRQRLRERPDEPLAAADGRARRDDDDRGPGGRAHGVRGGLLPRRLHDGGRPGRAADEDHGPAAAGATAFASVTVGRDGTCIVSRRASSLDERPADRDRLRRRRAAPGVGCRGAGSAATSPEAAQAAVAGLGATLDPPADVHASADYRRRLAEVVVARAIVQAGARARADGSRDRDEPADHGRP